MSDGVHDNLDPEMQGIPPYELVWRTLIRPTYLP